MKISNRDKSNYLKGLLILAKRDNVLEESEEQIIKNIASRLGFSSDFYEYTLENLIENEFLSEEPVQFSNMEIAQSFIVDGIRLAHSDNHLDEREIAWLMDTANKNKIDADWFNSKLKEIRNNPNQLSLTDFALYSII